MNPRVWGIIGGVALVLALLSPLVLGSSKKVERLFKEAEKLQQRANYEEAIVKYRDALSASKKLGVNTEVIDEDFTTLANYNIARCYYELARQSRDVNYYATALGYVKAVFPNARVVKHQEALTYLWAQILYKTEQFELAAAKFREFIANFPNSRYIDDAADAIARMNAEDEPLEPESDENAPPEPVEQEAQTLLRGAQALLDAEDYEGAHREFDSLATDENLRNQPEIQAKAMFEAAYCLEQLGRNSEALNRYSELINTFPENSPYVTEAYVNKGKIYTAQRDYINARENYESAMYTTESLERRAELYNIYHQTYLVPMRARMEERALEAELADEASEKYARLIQANRLFGERQFLEAAKEYEAFAAESPADTEVPYAIYQSGSCYYHAAFEKAEPFGKAVTVFQKLIDAYRDSEYAIKAYHGIAVAYRDWAQEHGDDSKWWLVIKTVEEANEKYANSDDEIVWEFLGRMKPIKDSALEYLKEKAKSKAQIAINNAEKEVQRANKHNAWKHAAPLMEEATTLLSHAKEAHRAENDDYAFNLAEQASAKAREAVTEARKAEGQQSTYLPKNYIDEGHEALEKGALVTAEKKARQALKIDTNARATRRLLDLIKQTYYGTGLAFLDDNQYTQAIKAFENATRIDPSFAKAQCNLGFIYIEQNHQEKAIAPLKKAIKANPKFKEAHFNLGIAYLRLGQFELARDAAGIVLELCDTSRKDPVCEAAEVLLGSIAE